jgi:hypothetical protein
MRRRRHPLSGAIYDVGADGLVRVDLNGKQGVFTASGTWVRGELHQADPHLCGWLAGPQLPTGFAGNPKDLPPASPAVESDDRDGDVVRHG